MKKNLVVLLIIPFLIALLGITAVNTTFNFIAPDIISIDWDYKDVEPFKLSQGRYELKAVGVSDDKSAQTASQKLNWTVTGKDGLETSLARITYEGAKTYLEVLGVGEVVITVSNVKGNIFRSMTGLIYENGIIAVSTVLSSSQKNIDPNIYYGEYDFNEDNSKKVNATFDLNVTVLPNELASSMLVKEISSNINYDETSKKVTINSDGDAYIKFGFMDEAIAPDTIFKFKVVDNGVNVYDYEDLLKCTNYSKDGEVVVLRKSFESYENIQKQGEKDNVTLFGNYLGSKNKYSFKDEVAYIETTFNKDYITEWNEFANNNTNYKKLSSSVVAGLHVKKSFYGNGYTLNMHNLTYPYSSRNVKDDKTGKTVQVPALNNDNLFRGPLPFYCLGDPNGKPLVTAFGQDNIGMYVDGDDIIINDINLKSCDFGDNLANLTYVGTTLETSGKNITVKNSVLGNGKNVMRCFSSDVLVDNCMLSSSRNFLIVAGSNEYLKIDGDRVVEFDLADGSSVTSTIAEFLAKNGKGDELVTQYLGGSFTDKEAMRKALDTLKGALNDEESVRGIYKGEVTINDSVFFQSGISSIALESYFNGPYLYSNVPSLIGTIFNMVGGNDLIPLEPNGVGGISYPVKVNISGSTNFYDYKLAKNIDISGLIDENISEIAANEDYDIEVSIDDFFPIKTLLLSQARKNGCTYNGTKDDIQGEYINIPVAYYGGGVNLSTVDFTNLDAKEQLGQELVIDFLDHYLEPSSTDDLMAMIRDIMKKAVTVVTGIEPFRFICTKGTGYKFNETPSAQILINNARGELQDEQN